MKASPRLKMSTQRNAENTFDVNPDISILGPKMKFMKPSHIATPLSIALIASLTFVAVSASADSPPPAPPPQLAQPRAEQRIAVVAMQEAVGRTEDGLRAQATLKKLFDNRQQELNSKQNELTKQKDELDKKGPSMKDFQKKAEEWQKAMVQLQTVYVEYNKELDQQRAKILEPIFDELTKIVRRISAEKFDIVLDKSTVVLVKPEYDLTEQAIQQYNASKAQAKAPAKKAEGDAKK